MLIGHSMCYVLFDVCCLLLVACFSLLTAHRLCLPTWFLFAIGSLGSARCDPLQRSGLLLRLRLRPNESSTTQHDRKTNPTNTDCDRRCWILVRGRSNNMPLLSFSNQRVVAVTMRRFLFLWDSLIATADPGVEPEKQGASTERYLLPCPTRFRVFGTFPSVECREGLSSIRSIDLSKTACASLSSRPVSDPIRLRSEQIDGTVRCRTMPYVRVRIRANRVGKHRTVR